MDVLSVALDLAMPFVLQSIVQYIQGAKSYTINLPGGGISLAFLLFVMSVLRIFFYQTSRLLHINLSTRISLGLNTAVYEKALDISNKASLEFSEGQILQMINSDVKAVSGGLTAFSKLIITPIQVRHTHTHTDTRTTIHGHFC
jgi:hypothetical protein